MAATHRHKSAQRDRELIRAAQAEASELRRAPVLGIPPSDSIPGYVITREIGRGGMAVIYEAQQQEPPRAVALKVMRSGGTVSMHRLRLFRQEVETLARLSCPNIAAIYGAGSTTDGHHYFAMELVRGSPVTEYVRMQNLPLRQQLLLFQRICQAVHYAHQRGVIHRDLKPSNIIVDLDGNPKVLDFGLARMTEADEAMRAMFTEAGKIMGTLPYMSPEQAEGNLDTLDIRTDIYSLGVILYELLTDHLPYDLTEVDHEEARRVIRDEAPPRPGRFRRQVRGDLEAIVLKALEKDPALRYQSALALSEDIGRYLARQPVAARAPTIAYLVRKFVVRQWLPVAFSLAFLLMLGGFATWVTMDAERQRLDELQRQRAVEREQRKIEAEKRDRSQEAMFWKTVMTTRAGRETLDRAAELVEREFADKAALAAGIRETLGVAYERLGRAEDARQQWDTAAVALRKAAEQRLQRGDLDNAAALLVQEYEMWRKHDAAQARKAALSLTDIYTAAHKPQQAATWRKRAESLGPAEEEH
jgi:eukaryotic-like serine/threonine-protein kinase